MTSRSRRPTATAQPPQAAAAAFAPRPGRDREPKKRARTGAVFPFKSAIAVGIVLILVGAGILWGKSAVTTVSGLFKSVAARWRKRQRIAAAPQSKPKIPDRVGQPSSTGAGRAGGAARGAV